MRREQRPTKRLWIAEFAIVVLLFFGNLNAFAENPPLWELGVGAGLLDANDYRGSDHRSTYYFPIPYITYRGKRLRVDRGGLRGILLDQNRIKFNISLNGTIPANSDDNPKREGMPDLKPTLEIGPSMEFTISQQGNHRTRFMLPLRAVFATDLQDTESAGWLSYPHLNLDMPERYDRWDLSFNLGPLFGDRRYHQYFYGVDEQFKTSNRSAYDAGSGYSGTSAIFNVVRRHKHYWIGAFIRYDNLEGASFENSPLLERKSYIMAGVAFSWIFKHSDKSVDQRDYWR